MSHPETPHAGWKDGPPPHIGWWVAEVAYAYTGHLATVVPGQHWGWWDGKGWSAFAGPTFTPQEAAIRASKLGANDGATAHVRWSHYWPADARVPRIDPRPGRTYA